MAIGVEGFPPIPAASIDSDAYLRFLVDELKPFIDSTYRTRADRDDTAAMRAAGYTPGRNWVTRRFEGAEHSERAWRARVDAPLLFLLGK